MKIRREYLIAIFFGAVLTCIIIAMAFLTLSPRETEQGPSPTPIAPNQTPRSPQTKTNPPIQYEQDATKRMLDKLNTRPPLTPSDTAARKKILSFLPSGQISGVLYNSPTVTIDYTSAADQIQVEILTVDIAQAKRDATSWLRSQGLSQRGICDLPVVFYLSSDVLNQVRNKNFTLSPLAEGC